MFGNSNRSVGFCSLSKIAIVIDVRCRFVMQKLLVWLVAFRFILFFSSWQAILSWNNIFVHINRYILYVWNHLIFFIRILEDVYRIISSWAFGVIYLLVLIAICKWSRWMRLKIIFIMKFMDGFWANVWMSYMSFILIMMLLIFRSVGNLKGVIITRILLGRLNLGNTGMHVIKIIHRQFPWIFLSNNIMRT